MKRIFTIFTFVIGMISVGSAWSQALFNVVASTNTYLNGKLVAVGDVIEKGKTLNVKSEGYIALIHLGGKSVEVTESGNYKTDDLASNLGEGSSNFAGKYADFVMSKMAADGSDGYDYSTTGSVHRGADIRDVEDIKFISPDNIDLVKGIPAKLNWTPVVGQKDYVVYIENLFGDVVFMKEVAESSIELDVEKMNLEPSQRYLIKVRLKEGSSSKKHVVALVKEDNDAEAIRRIVSELSSELKDDSPIDNLVLASFYNEKGLKLNAVESLHHAVTLAPGVEDYKKTYRKYLLTNGVQPID